MWAKNRAQKSGAKMWAKIRAQKTSAKKKMRQDRHPLYYYFARSHPERDADTNMEKSLTFQLLVILKRVNVSPEFVKLHRLRAFYSELNSMACLNLTEKIVNIVVTEVVLAF